MLGTPPAFILSQDQTLMLKWNVSSETFKILIWKKFSRSKWTWLPFLSFYWIGLFLNYLIAQMILDNSCSLNFLIYHVVSWHGLLSWPLLSFPAIRSPSQKASKYKEYIQGCISVLFSYKVGNVCAWSCRAGTHQPLSRWFSVVCSFVRQLWYHTLIWLACQQLF